MIPLSKKVTIGTFWSFVSQSITKLLSITSTIVLARLLTPSDFGVFNIANVWAGFIAIFSTVGLDAALISRQERVTEYKNAAFLLNSLINIFFVFILFISAPIIASFYKVTVVKYMIWILGFGLLIKSIGVIPQAGLTKDFSFSSIAFCQILTAFSTFSIAIILAVLGFRAWSLVYSVSLGYAIGTFSLLITSKFRLSLDFPITILYDLINYSKYVFGRSILWYLIMSIDIFIIGKIFGTHSLGIYSMALNQAIFITMNITAIIGNVALPAFSYLKSGEIALRETFTRIVKVLALITIPAHIYLFILAKEFIIGLFGIQWLDAVLPFRILLIMCFIRSMVPSDALFFSMAKTKIIFYIALITLPFILLSVIIGAKFGITGIACAVSFVMGIVSLINIYICSYLLKIRIKEFFFNLMPFIVSSLCMAFIVVLVNFLLYNFIGDIFRLILTLLFGSLSYILCLKSLYPKEIDVLNRVINIFRDKTKS